MAGNENSVVKYLLSKRGKLFLNHLGVISSVANPGRSGDPIEIKTFDEVVSCDSHKKADIYLMDEPFVGVDAATENSILKLLKG